MFSLRTARPSRILQSITGSTPSTSRLVAGRRFYSDYGSGETNPNTSNPSVDKEHPGPPPPSTADKGKNADKSQQQPSSGQAQQSNTDASKKSTSDAQPKLNTNTPAGEESEEVARHNREMEKRADKAHSKAKSEDDKVHKGFWSGQGGVDKDP